MGRLPLALRAQVNLKLRDNVPVAKINSWLHTEHAAALKEAEVEDLNRGHIDSWRRRGFKKWEREQERLEDMKAQREFAFEMARQNDGSRQQASLAMAADNDQSVSANASMSADNGGSASANADMSGDMAKPAMGGDMKMANGGCGCGCGHCTGAGCGCCTKCGSSNCGCHKSCVCRHEHGCELRVLELCRGQVLGFASREEASPPTELIQVPWSPRDQVGSHPDYEVRAIDGTQFEAAWENRWRM